MSVADVEFLRAKKQEAEDGIARILRELHLETHLDVLRVEFLIERTTSISNPADSQLIGVRIDLGL